MIADAMLASDDPRSAAAAKWAEVENDELRELKPLVWKHAMLFYERAMWRNRSSTRARRASEKGEGDDDRF